MVSNFSKQSFEARHIQVTLIFSMVVIMYTISMSPPIIIVAMVTPGTSPNLDVPIFSHWTIQSLILTSYYWGFAPAHLVGGPLSKKFGTKWFMVGSMVIVSFVSICIPSLVITFGPLALMGCLFIEGLCHGTVRPMLADFISRWAPISERTTVAALIYGTSTLGTVFGTALSGFLSSSWWGWPSAFYLYGCLGMIWTVGMLMYGQSDPNSYKEISKSELDFINDGKSLTKQNIPWRKICCSGPVWATWVTHSGIIWSTRLCSVEFPTYINKVLGFSVAYCSTVMSITYLLSYITTLLVSKISQWAINLGYVRIGPCRIICNSIGAFGASTCLILLAAFSSNRYFDLSLALFIFFIVGFSFCGYNVNYNDLSINYSGCLFGIGGIISATISFIPTTLVQFMVIDQSDPNEWSKAFWLSAIITILTSLIFVIHGSGEIQEWDNVDDEEESRYLLEKMKCLPPPVSKT